MAEMEVDQSSRYDEGAGDSAGSSQEDKLDVNGEGEVLNHIDQNKQNGYPESGEGRPKEEKARHSESSKHKEHRDKDRDKKHGSSSSSKHSSSSSSSKHHSSSSSSKHKDGHSSSSSSHKHSSSSSSKHKDGSSSSSSKHGSSSSSKDKHSSSSSSSRDKDKHKSSSSSSDKHKHSSSSSSKHSSSSDKHRDKDKDKHKSSSSSSKHSSSSSSGHKKENNEAEKERQERKEKERQERKEKERQERKEREKKEKEEKERKEKEALEAQVKDEPESPERAPVKEEPESDEDDDDVPLSVRLKQEQADSKPIKREREESEEEDDDDDDDVPLSARVEKVKKVKKEVKAETPKSGKKRKAPASYAEDDEESEDEKPLKKKKPAAKKAKAAVKTETVKTATASPKKKGKKVEEAAEVWKWWEEDKKEDGVKWNFLEHKGPVFAPDYERVPKNVKFYYDGNVMELSQDTEEVATFYARMLEHDYTTKEIFNTNFMKDWRKVMTDKEREKLTDLKKCNFKDMAEYFKEESEKRKNRSKEEKLALKNENARLVEEYGFCTMDGHKEKIGNFRIEPPGLFRGRGDHPKQGRLKRRTMPEEVIINCSKDSKIPEPPAGHKWKRVQHDNAVSWLASWSENIQGQTKYVMLNAASRLKGEKDWQKYETARRLHKCVDKIRANYQEDWKSKEMRIRQRSVALYFIDKLALRAGNEKETDESADTVGCCSLRVEHVKLHPETDDGKQHVVEFDFLGKDSIRYQNSVPVEKRVFKNLQMFVENKQPQDDLFDRLNTVILNKHLSELMEGLTAKVFRTYNASRTLQEQLNIMTNPDDPIAAKMLSYNRANRAVAILCNHQRAAPKNFSKQMENIMAKIKDKRALVKEAKNQLKKAKGDFKVSKTQNNKAMYEKKKKTFTRLEEQLTKLEVQATDKDENKEIALGTSKLNYLDPRISVAWCKKWEVPLEKVYNKTQRDKFRWAIDMAEADYEF